MTKPPSPSTLSVAQWIKLTPRALMERGCDPELRKLYTGHVGHIDETWLPAIGNWARADTKDLIDTKNPNLGMIRVKSGAYRQYRHRYALLTGSEFELIHGFAMRAPWFHAEYAWCAYRDWQKETADANGGVTQAIGTACFDLHHARARSDNPALRPGMLPVELVLWTRLFDTFLAATDLRYEFWEGLVDEEKELVWEGGPQGRPWDLEHVRNLGAVLELGDDRLGGPDAGHPPVHRPRVPGARRTGTTAKAARPTRPVSPRP